MIEFGGRLGYASNVSPTNADFDRHFIAAKERLTTAIDLFRECGADGWVTRTEKALAELS
ncbi:MAG: hypothetical protein Q8K00_11790 [Syntrophales bacterium]|nr:hypothetical protein [Syntrophales bacterium]